MQFRQKLNKSPARITFHMVFVSKHATNLQLSNIQYSVKRILFIFLLYIWRILAYSTSKLYLPVIPTYVRLQVTISPSHLHQIPIYNKVSNCYIISYVCKSIMFYLYFPINQNVSKIIINTLMKIFLIEASLIFSIAKRIFSAFSIAADVGFKVSYSLFSSKIGG